MYVNRKTNRTYLFKETNMLEHFANCVELGHAAMDSSSWLRQKGNKHIRLKSRSRDDQTLVRVCMVGGSDFRSKICLDQI